MKKIFIVACFVFISSLMVFYFWGSSGFYNKEEYAKMVVYKSKEFNDPDTLSIATFNIGYLSGMTNNLPVDRKESLFAENLSRVVSILKSYDFDLIGLQEIDFNSSRSYNYNQFDSLAKDLDFTEGAYAVNWDKSYVPFPYYPLRNHFGKMLSGQGVLSKMQINSNDLSILDKPLSAPFYYKAFYLDRLLQLVKVQYRSDTIIVMNVHLEAFDKLTREVQAEKVLLEFDKWAQDYPVILMGDFNSRPPFASEIVEEENTIKMFFDHPLIEEAISKERYKSNESKYFTFDTAKPFERLDYIFYNKNKIVKIDSDVLREADDISDHLPVWMSFKIIK